MDSQLRAIPKAAIICVAHTCPAKTGTVQDEIRNLKNGDEFRVLILFSERISLNKTVNEAAFRDFLMKKICLAIRKDTIESNTAGFTLTRLLATNMTGNVIANVVRLGHTPLIRPIYICGYESRRL